MKRGLWRAALVVLAVASACGSPEPEATSPSTAEVVQRAQQSLDERSSGRIDFVLTASAEEGAPVGFEISGDYQFDPDVELAVVDLTYRQVLGEEITETRVLSNGKRAWVVIEGEATDLTEEQSEPLRLGEASRAATVPPLDMAAWLRNGKLQETEGESVVTGEVDASALVDDLRLMAAQVGGAAVGETDEDTAAQIDAAVTSSEMRVETEDGELRAVTARVEFGATVPAALRTALGSYAGARLDLSVSVEDIEIPLEVPPPA